MDKGERQVLAEQITSLKQWSDLARRIVARREGAASQTQAASEALATRWLACEFDGRQVRVLPIDEASDALLMAELLTESSLQQLSSADVVALTIGSDDARNILHRAQGLVGARRHFMSAGTRREREGDAQAVRGMHQRALAEGLGAHLEALTHVGTGTPPSVIDVARELEGPDAGVVTGGLVDEARSVVYALEGVRHVKESAEGDIRRLGASIRELDVGLSLSEMPVTALKASTAGRLRFGAIEQSGLTSVRDVLEFGPALEHIDGVGEQTARQTWGAAETMRAMVQRETPLRIDVKRRDSQTEQLLSHLWTWAQASTMLTRANESAGDIAGLTPLLASSARVPSHFVLPSRRVAERLSEVLVSCARWEAEARLLDDPPEDLWSDFLRRPADYLGWVRLFGFLTEDEGAAEGQLSSDLIDRVRRQELDTSLLRGVSLRGYQDFGARFAIVQRKVVIGDEMGLGKTIEALALLAHLHAKGATHSVVVCPAAVLSNWSREVAGRSALEVFVLHGSERGPNARRWSRRGGVAVTTFTTLRSVLDEINGVDELHAVVVDEAHYIKNPGAKRTVTTRALIDVAEHGLLLTGTPIENRLQEFANLVSYLQPDLLDRLDSYSPASFPKLIAPAYLRRNQEDVLTELPERIDVEEWIPMSRHDEEQYVAAVVEGNFMAMRRAALLGGVRSAKLERLVELVGEARANHRKVIVFSYFRDVLDAVVDVLDGELFGPLTGSVPANQRQRIVDEYSEASAGAVLVSQITAGGVGLNIQAGSVVVICEPQVKPSMESQAVARAHRMGQTETVQVHRLLSDEGVDRKMLEILAEKQSLFDEFARVSHTADSAPEAVDVTHADLASVVIAAERERLARRVQLDATASTMIEETA